MCRTLHVPATSPNYSGTAHLPRHNERLCLWLHFVRSTLSYNNLSVSFSALFLINVVIVVILDIEIFSHKHFCLHQTCVYLVAAVNTNNNCGYDTLTYRKALFDPD